MGNRSMKTPKILNVQSNMRQENVRFFERNRPHILLVIPRGEAVRNFLCSATLLATRIPSWLILLILEIGGCSMPVEYRIGPESEKFQVPEPEDHAKEFGR